MRASAATSVLARASVLLARHWPALVAIWLLGWLGREEAVRLAVHASKLHAVAGVLVLALAVVSEMVALVWMLRVLRTSAPLPAPSPAPGDPAATRWRRAGQRVATSLDSTAAVLIPFLAIYVAQDSFRLLFTDYASRVTQDAYVTDFVAGLTGGAAGGQRLPWGGMLVYATAAVAFVLRWLLRRRHAASGSPRSVLRSVVASYVEVVWLVLLVAAVNAKRKELFSWLDRRRVVRAGGDVVSSLVDHLGVVGTPIRWTWARITDTLASIDKVLLLPVATLTVAAIVYGATVAKPQPIDVAAAAQRGIERFEPGRRVSRRWSGRRSQRLARAEVVRVGKRFQPLIDGVRLLIGAGAVPMLVFCVMFGALQTLDEWMWHLWRAVLGPRPLNTWIAASDLLGTAGDLVVGVLGVALIGAAVERVVGDERADAAAADGEPALSPA